MKCVIPGNTCFFRFFCEHQTFNSINENIWLVWRNNKQPYLCTHRGCRPETSVDCNSIEIWITGGVVRKVVDSAIRLWDDIRSLAHHQPGDVQAHTQQQHTQHCQITGHTEEAGRERDVILVSFSFSKTLALLTLWNWSPNDYSAFCAVLDYSLK